MELSFLSTITPKKISLDFVNVFINFVGNFVNVFIHFAGDFDVVHDVGWNTTQSP